MDKLAQALSWMIDAFLLWLRCVRSPVVMLNELLRNENDEKCLSAATKVWMISLLIGLIPTFPVLNLYGVGWNNTGFYLSSWLVTSLNLVLAAIFTHRILIVLNLKSNFVRTLVMYTTPVVTYSPVGVLVVVYPMARLFEMIRAIKMQNLAIDDAALALSKVLLTTPIVSSHTLNGIVQFVGLLIGLCTMTIFAESVSQWYGNDRGKSYSAVSAALFLSGFASFFLSVPAYIFIIYAFVGRD